MSIRTRTAVIVLIPMCTLVLLFVYAGVKYVDVGFTRLESRDVANRVDLVADWILNQSGYQERNAQSYGAWDDTWDFVKNRDRDYIDWNMTPSMFGNIETDFMIMLDNEARLVYAKFVRHPSAQGQILRFLHSEPRLTHIPQRFGSRQATIASTVGPVALGLATIVPDTGPGAVRGTIVCGRFLDHSVEPDFTAVARFDGGMVSWWSPQQPGLPAPAGKAAAELAPSPEAIVVSQGGDGRTLGYGVVIGYERAKVAVVQATVDPKLAETRHLIRRAIGIGLLVFIIVGTTTFLFAIDVSVLRRLGRLITGVRRVGRSESESAARVPVEGKDEIAELATTVNEMLAAIDAQQGVLRRLATVDPLTGVHNRRRFMEEFERELERSRRLGSGGAVLSFDLDHFKKINDTYGHAAGDEVLTGVSSLLQGAARSYSTLARFGGDEFVMLLPGADREQGVMAAERLLKTLAEAELPAGDATARVQISIGVAFYPDDGETADAILKAADVAMYASKRDGRGRVSVAPGTHVKGEASTVGR